MKITSVDAINLSYEYLPNQRFRYGGGICTHRVTTLITISTDSGLTGIGSAYTHPSLAHLIVRDQLEPLLKGQDPTDINDLWNRMYGTTLWYGRKGAAVTTLGGVDTALWDLRGKIKGLPIWQILGGDSPSCDAYASGLLWKETTELAEEAISYIEKGYRRVKMRLARSEDYDKKAVQAVRKAIGFDFDIMVDTSMRYWPDLAQRMGDFFKEQGVFWYEEPFTPDDLEAYATLKQNTNVAIAAGENEFGLSGFRELIRANAVDIVQPDTARCGGITTTWEIAQMAHEHGLGVATHSWSDAIAIVSNAHVISAIPNGITVEIDQMANPFVENLLTEPLNIKDGRLHLTSEPGLGIELDMDLVEHYKMKDPLNVPPGVYSDMMFGVGNFPPPFRYHTSST